MNVQIIAPLLDNTLTIIRQRGFFAFIRFFYVFTAIISKSVFLDNVFDIIRVARENFSNFFDFWNNSGVEASL